MAIAFILNRFDDVAENNSDIFKLDLPLNTKIKIELSKKKSPLHSAMVVKLIFIHLIFATNLLMCQT